MKSHLFLLSFLSCAIHGIAQTVYLAGDSTMALGGSGSGTQGWGAYLADYLTIPVVNCAKAGRSARSYTTEGRFRNLINTVQRGDYVIVEFGHNDASAGAIDNGRQDADGTSYYTTATVITSTGRPIIIHTFPYYIQNAVTALKEKGAIPIVSSQTPDSIWSGGSIVALSPFVGYARISAQRTGVTFVDHYAYTAQAYNNLGEAVVDGYYPAGHVHTAPAGARVVTEAFVRGLLCGPNSLKNLVNDAGRAVPNGCL